MKKKVNIELKSRRRNAQPSHASEYFAMRVQRNEEDHFEGLEKRSLPPNRGMKNDDNDEATDSTSFGLQNGRKQTNTTP